MTMGPLPLSDWLPLFAEHPWVVRCVFCSVLVIALTWLMAFGASRRSAAIRHRIFSLGFAGLLIAPVAIAITAGWNPTISLSGESKPPTDITSDDPSESPKEVVNPVPSDTDTPRITPVKPDPLSQTSFGPTNLPAREPQLNHSSKKTVDPVPVPHSMFSVSELSVWLAAPQRFFSAVWAAGVLLLGVKFVGECFLIRNIVRSGVLVTDDKTISLLHDSRRATQRFSNHRLNREQVSPQLLCSSSTSVPIATGILVPRIILPAGFGKWTNERLRIVLMHELTHINRRDVLANLVAHLACTLYWCNPLVWLAARRMSLERELACDDYLLCLGECAESYANDLIEIVAAIKQHFRTAHLATPMAAQSSLKIRVQHLMKADLDRQSVSTRISVTTALLTLATVTTLATVSPSFGVDQSSQPRKISDPNDVAVTLSGEIPRDWIEQLKVMPNLQKLTIRNPALETLKVTQLRELKNLTEFSAEDFSVDSRLADILAVNLAQLPNIKSLQFHRTGLTGRGLQALSRSPAADLILDGEELMTDADFKHVARMPSLSTLVLDTTPIEVDGLTALQAASGLRRLVLRRHPAGSYEKGSEARIKTIAGFENLESLELGDAGYSHLVPLKTCKNLKLLTLRNCGAFEASKSLRQLTQLKRVEIDSCDIRDESFDHVKSSLGELGIVLVDITQAATDSLTRSSATPDEATQFARNALDDLNMGKHFRAFWIGWKQHWSKIPAMTAQPVRTVHRLKQALIVEHEKQPWGQDTQFAYAPGQFFLRALSMTNDVANWQTVMYGDAKLARSREGQVDAPPVYVIRNGVREFEESLGLHFPRQLFITHQQMWWGTPTHHSITSSSVPPQAVAYVELAEEGFGGEPCRVLQAPGRSERLWVGKASGRLRGALHFIHQGYFTPFFNQDVVTKLVGRRIESNEEYSKLFAGPGAIAKEVQHQLTQAWAEHEFSHAYPGNLVLLDDYRQITPDRWFPFKVTTSGWQHHEANEGNYDFHVSEAVVTEISIDRNDLEPFWAEYLPKEGEAIQDQR